MLRKIAGSMFLGTALLGAAASHAKEAPQLDQKSSEVLKATTDYIAALKSFSYTAHTLTEVVSGTNEKITLDTDLAVAIKRPNKILAKKRGFETMDFYYDGSKIIGFNPKILKYAAADAPNDIDGLVKVLSNYQIEAPMSDFITADPYQVLTSDLKSGRYLGTADIGGVKCHHLAFRQDNVDWQLWVDAGDSPVIKRFQVTSKDLTGSPTFTVNIGAWQANPDLNDSTFEFIAPGKAALVEFKDLNPE